MKLDKKHFIDISTTLVRNHRNGIRIACIALMVFAFLAGTSLFSTSLHRVGAEPGTGVVSNALPRQAPKTTSDDLWQPASDTAPLKQRESRTLAQSYSTKTLNREVLAALLSQAPLEFTDEAASKQAILTLPMPSGELARFRIEESPIMERSLADEHPEIKTYAGQGIDDPSAAMRLDWTPLGLHAIVISLEGTYFIEPFSQFDTTTYISYFIHDVSTDRLLLSCLLSNEEIEDAEQRGVSLNQGPASPAFVTGATLRTYRLAVAATGEFTQQYGGGNVNTTLAQITTLINLVDAVYRREATITFQLIANETSIIFTNPATDGYTNGTPSTMLAENQAKLDSVIGSANYDIGHVLGGITVNPGFVSFSGVASLGVVCGGSKGRGVSTMGGGSSFPHSIFVSGTTHEFAHQFSAPHTFNSTTSGCAGQRSAAGAYEPGSGSTIMGYSICGSDNIQNLPDLYFHTGSLEQIVSYAAGAGNCASTTATTNGAPVISSLTNFTIPANTPFTLNASVTDPNGDPLNCVWEEFDLGAASPPNGDDGTRPLFRSFLPSSNTARTFPRLQNILNNANVPPTNYGCGSGTCLTGEVLPSTTRTMNFRFTARDNRSSGGGTANSPMQVSVVSTAGPFAVTQPNTAVSWPGGSSQVVTWNVAATASAPINCANVKISLSTDGGNTFPLVLSASTPNDGSENVFIPNSPTSLARIKVEAVGNIFFDISNMSFIITPGSSSHPDTIGLYRPGISAFYLRNTNTVGFPDLSISYGAAGDMPVVGDWDGNGTTTIGLYRAGISTFYLRNTNSTGSPDIIVSFGDGPGGDIPIVGDWDGDGDTTIGVYRPSTSTFYLKNTNTPGFPDLSIPFGAPGDLPIVGDWDGNGTTTIGLYRPSGSVFFLRNSNSPGFPDLSIAYGAAGDLPIVGDWDGNGTVTIGLYRPTGGVFYLRNTNDPGFPDLSIPYGAAGDKAIAGDWDGL